METRKGRSFIYIIIRLRKKSLDWREIFLIWENNKKSALKILGKRNFTYWSNFGSDIKFLNENFLFFFLFNFSAKANSWTAKVYISFKIKYTCINIEYKRLTFLFFWLNLRNNLNSISEGKSKILKKMIFLIK